MPSKGVDADEWKRFGGLFLNGETRAAKLPQKCRPEAPPDTLTHIVTEIRSIVHRPQLAVQRAGIYFLSRPFNSASRKIEHVFNRQPGRPVFNGRRTSLLLLQLLLFIFAQRQDQQVISHVRTPGWLAQTRLNLVSDGDVLELQLSVSHSFCRPLCEQD